MVAKQGPENRPKPNNGWSFQLQRPRGFRFLASTVIGTIPIPSNRSTKDLDKDMQDKDMQDKVFAEQLPPSRCQSTV
jgi:hypothetical protein